MTDKRDTPNGPEFDRPGWYKTSVDNADEFRVTAGNFGYFIFGHQPCVEVLLTTQSVSLETLERLAHEHKCSDTKENPDG